MKVCMGAMGATILADLIFYLIWGR
jgi:hypothetical protein